MSFSTAPLTGRDRERRDLLRLAGVAAPPRSGLVLLSGDAGIGKSRLLDALTGAAAGQGWRVAVGHCLDLGGSPLPYLPFTEIAARLEATRPELLARLAERWPAVRRLLARDPGAGAAEPLDRGLFFESLHAVLVELAREAPLLLVIEDLHWADRSTCDLLTYLFTRGLAAVPGRRGTPSAVVSVVASYRSDDLHRRHPLRSIAAGWSRLPGVDRLDLQPLPDDQVRELVRALHPDPLDERDLQTVVERAEGNAFFTEELVAAVGSSAPGPAGMPPDLAGLLLLRLDQLEPTARLVVRAAAVGGRQVRDAVLATVAGLDPDGFEAAVRTAVEFHVLVPDADGYRFRHSMLAEAVYDDLLPGERRRLHAAFVAALTGPAAGVAPAGTAADLARHALAAGDADAAYAASVAAGDDATAAGGPDEAARHYALALDLLDGSTLGGETVRRVRDRVTLTELAASAAATAGLVVRAEAVVADQLRRLPPDAPPTDRARLLVARAEAALLSESSTDVLATAAEAVALVDADPPTVLRGRAVGVYATALSSQRRDVEAVRWAEEGLALPPELRTGEVTAQLQTVMARISERLGDAGESERILRRLLATTSGTGDFAEVRVLFQLGGIALEQGDLEQAHQTYRRAADRSAELGRPFAPYGADSRVLAGQTAYQLGRWDLALEVTAVGLDGAPALAAAGLLGVVLTVRAGRGQPTGWPALMERIRPEWTTDGMVAVHSAAAAIDLLGDAGALDDALALHDEVVACVTRVWHTPDFQAQIRLAAVLLGQLTAGLPDVLPERRPPLLDRAARIADAAEEALGVGRRHDRGTESRAWLARLAGERLRLRRAAGEPVDPGELAAAWGTTVEAFTRYGEPYELARSRSRYAAALRLAGDAAGARDQAGQAREVAERLRAAPLLAELRPLTGRAPGASAGSQVLTPREREVLGLVAEGRSNREIGEQLFVSAKTASVHVSNILAKLGARSRTEAASLARRRGLLG